jgi:hypothetical protein
MIRLAEPHMALNALETDKKLRNDMGRLYKMSVTCMVPEAWSPQQIVDEIVLTAKSVAGQRLGGVVLNSHGLFTKASGHGGFGIGLGSGIRIQDTPLFQRLRGFVDEIYITSCEIARQTVVGGYGDGQLLCSQIASSADAYVYASDVKQMSWSVVPRGFIDGFEGRVYRWGRNGTSLGSRERWRSGKWDAAAWLHDNP